MRGSRQLFYLFLGYLHLSHNSSLNRITLLHPIEFSGSHPPLWGKFAPDKKIIPVIVSKFDGWLMTCNYKICNKGYFYFSPAFNFMPYFFHQFLCLTIVTIFFNRFITKYVKLPLIIGMFIRSQMLIILLAIPILF